MWLIVYRENVGWGELERRVFAIEGQEPPEGAYTEEKFEIKEWDGPPPFLGDPTQGIPPDLDPTLGDADHADKVQQCVDFEALAEKAGDEIAWLEETIPQIDGMAAAEVQAVVKRLAQENLRCIRAWRYVIRRLR